VVHFPSAANSTYPRSEKTAHLGGGNYKDPPPPGRQRCRRQRPGRFAEKRCAPGSDRFTHLKLRAARKSAIDSHGSPAATLSRPSIFEGQIHEEHEEFHEGHEGSFVIFVTPSRSS
jgi:hypothetical protein